MRRYDLEIGNDSGVIRVISESPIAEEAFFPEVRPDRPTGGSEDRDRDEKIQDVIEWL
jgi:hypothetical protein